MLLVFDMYIGCGMYGKFEKKKMFLEIDLRRVWW